MFSSIINAFSVLANLSKIKAAAQASYEVVVKLIAVLKVVDQQITGTPIEKEVDKYLPTAIKSLDTIKTLAEKFAPILGINVAPATVASSATTNARTALSNASAALALHV